MAKRLFDTNAILTDCTDISNVLISSKTLDELENIKSSSHKDNDVKYKARVAVRAIREQKPEIVVVQKSDYDKIEEAQKNYKKQLDNMKTYILERTEIDEKTFNKNKNKDWYLSFEELERYRIVDKIITSFDEIL